MKNYLILIVSLGFLNLNSLAQEKNLSFETPDLSAGAEYSIYLQNLINSGQAKHLEYKASIPLLNKPEGIDAITTFEGINFDQDATTTGYYNIPPDPIGAAGPNHLVSVVNTAIEWFTKAGVKQYTNRLGKNATTHVGSFFESLTPLTSTFDPKVIYDQYNGRFVVITLEQTTTLTQTSRILVAVSQTNDPNAGWYFTSINSRILISGVNYSWADYPGLAVGTNAIYITANMYRFSNSTYWGGRVWIIAKSPFYSGGAASINVYDHITLAGGYGSTYQPTQMFGTPQTNVGTFLLLYGGLSDGTNESVNVIRVDNPLTSPTFTGQNVALLNIDNTAGSYLNAPQLGTSTLINTNDRRSQNAIWRSNALWASFTVVPNSGLNAGQVTAHWVKINTSTLGSLVVSDQGDIGGEDIATGTYTFFPSIAINSVGDAIIGFAASAPTIYPGAYYVGRYSTTPAGTVLATQIFKPGLDYYIRTFGTGRNRWGDYSGSSVDPSDDQTFYIFNEYALTRGTPISGEEGRWGTAFGVVPVSALPVELSAFTAKILKSGGVQLNWRTETEVNNYGFEIQKSEDRNQESEWNKIGFVPGHGNSNSPKDYSFEDKNAKYGSYAYRLKQIDTDGKFEYSKVIEVDAGRVPDGFVLEQNYPNPFNPATTIKFAVAETQKAELKVFDILGNEVVTLFNDLAEGNRVYEFEFNSEGMASGIYFYRLEAGNKIENKKMLLLK